MIASEVCSRNSENSKIALGQSTQAQRLSQLQQEAADIRRRLVTREIKAEEAARLLDELKVKHRTFMARIFRF